MWSWTCLLSNPRLPYFGNALTLGFYPTPPYFGNALTLGFTLHLLILRMLSLQDFSLHLLILGMLSFQGFTLHLLILGMLTLGFTLDLLIWECSHFRVLPYTSFFWECSYFRVFPSTSLFWECSHFRVFSYTFSTPIVLCLLVFFFLVFSLEPNTCQPFALATTPSHKNLPKNLTSQMCFFNVKCVLLANFCHFCKIEKFKISLINEIFEKLIPPPFFLGS